MYFSKPVNPDRLSECMSNAAKQSAPSSPPDDESGEKKSSENKSSEPSECQLPTLIPPKIIPLLRVVIQQMLQAGHLNQVFVIYR